jgi:uncharacterized protein YecE (DUF72 family)
VIFVGTSGWQYDDWRGRFYPNELPKSAWLTYFSQRFSTVEVNNSFYRLPSEDTFARWRRESAPGFVVGVKASRFITHIKRLKDPAPSVQMFVERTRALRDKLGPVLFQLPPRFHADPERLRGVLAALPSGMRCAFEFRDASWDTGEMRALLDRSGAAFVLADRPGRRIHPHVTGGWSYVRFHQGRTSSPFYTRPKLARWADRIAELPARDVYVYFNNDPHGAAVRDAGTMIELLVERGARVAPAPGDIGRSA